MLRSLAVRLHVGSRALQSCVRGGGGFAAWILNPYAELEAKTREKESREIDLSSTIESLKKGHQEEMDGVTHKLMTEEESRVKMEKVANEGQAEVCLIPATPCYAQNAARLPSAADATETHHKTYDTPSHPIPSHPIPYMPTFRTGHSQTLPFEVERDQSPEAQSLFSESLAAILCLSCNSS